MYFVYKLVITTSFIGSCFTFSQHVHEDANLYLVSLS